MLKQDPIDQAKSTTSSCERTSAKDNSIGKACQNISQMYNKVGYSEPRVQLWDKELPRPVTSKNIAVKITW